FGPGRENFVTKVLKRARQESQLHVVQDQVGSPTYTLDLARGILALILGGARGLYHVANTGSCSRFELAQAVLKHAGMEQIPIRPIESTDPIARRPAYSALDTTAFTEKTGSTLPDWQDGLHRYMDSLNAET
ncbi:MAG: sugar nucleotide-binding protein, partial [Proteobacteria bacterium]|nr:sugar nucleotide-binding protein [Pseudomonadota bacterium]